MPLKQLHIAIPCSGPNKNYIIISMLPCIAKKERFVADCNVERFSWFSHEKIIAR
jgi:hypothetical protein